jgi:hypothetical protein
MSGMVWGVNVMTLTRSRVRIAITTSPMWGEQLFTKSTASHPVNSSDSCSSLRYGIKILLMYSKKSLPLTYDFDRCRNTKLTLRQMPDISTSCERARSPAMSRCKVSVTLLQRWYTWLSIYVSHFVMRNYVSFECPSSSGRSLSCFSHLAIQTYRFCWD